MTNMTKCPPELEILYTETRIARDIEGQSFCDLVNYFDRHADLQLILPKGMIENKKCILCKANTLQFSAKKFLWYCTDCNKGGDIFSFVELTHKLTPIETILLVYSKWPDYFTVMDRDIYIKYLQLKQIYWVRKNGK